MLLVYSGGGVEGCEVAGAGGREGCAGEPVVDPDEVERGGGQLVLEPGFGQAAVAGSACAEPVDGMADGAFDPGPGPVFLLLGRGFLLDPGVGEGLVLRLG